uniref:Uncharacterized protein LOC105136902 n=1 Tax=Rhizophora mucronata TaxID=61149 RepID=A0A2P2MYP4_RHIMU
MASSENLASLEPWSVRPTVADWWISEAYARDTEILTKALQKSLYNDSNITTTTPTITTNSNSVSLSETLTSDSLNPLLALINNETASAVVPPATPTASHVYASDPETAQKRQGKVPPGPSGKALKRKSRASKRSQTTFITADPADFRQMVQQVTGVRFCNSQVSLMKPEPQRPGGRLQGCGGGGSLPTLDTSAFLLDRHQQQVVMGSTSGSGSGPDVGPDPISFPQPLVVADGVCGGGGGAGSGAGSDFDAFSSFPTLESWKVM